MATNIDPKRYVMNTIREKEWYEDEIVMDQPMKQVYSLARITFMDGTTQDFMVKASPSVTPHLVKEMKSSGFLTLWNDSDTLCIRADLVKHFEMRQVTNQQEK